MTDWTLTGFPRLLERIEAEAELMAGSAEGADPELEVPGCPGLTLGDTVRHVGSVYRMALAWVRSGVRPTAWQREPDEDQSVTDYLRAGMRAVVDQLTAHPPDTPCPTWWPEHETYGFWYRRLAHETTVHRVDVQSAAGLEPDEVPRDVAVDGVDEVLTLWFAHRLDVLGVSGTRHARLKIRAGGHEWMARSTPHATSSWRVDKPDELGDGTITADPYTMYLWLWGRLPPHIRKLERDGSEDAIAQIWALLRLATR